MVFVSGGGVEANLLVGWGGPPLKVVFVAALTWVLYQKRPSALIWPTLALLCVVGYHVSGLLVNR